ncbi:bifunctional lysylphosphatidylglycerol synthetase/lysine--tRNA ligase LysX [Georgenia faecalis]|uniref:Lysine--tRNA ligase n=1 Tax=Georgenia faecalis TaxID=2483799 RepID=A0ABV9D5Q4_9MICO|nr:bifunctional lysylphosphatidylglycerol synthetase/lysine--tRNA ligase LysX [Georgenia faecalis]
MSGPRADGGAGVGSPDAGAAKTAAAGAAAAAAEGTSGSATARSGAPAGTGAARRTRGARAARTGPAGPGTPRGRGGPAWANRVALGTGRAVQAIAIWLLVGLVLQPSLPGPVHEVSRWLSVLNVPSQPGFFSVVLVGVVASGLLRRLRAALWFVILVWQLPSLVVGVLAAVAVVTGEPLVRTLDVAPTDVIGAVVAAVVIPLLVAARPAFQARLRSGAWWQGALVTVAGIVLATVVAFLLLRVVPDSVGGPGDALQWSASHAVGIHPGGAAGDAPAWVGVVASLISAVGLLVGLAIFLRSSTGDPARRAEDALAVRRLLLEDGAEDSLGYFATRDDRSAVFASNERAAVSYRVVSGVSLAAGDPVGDPDAWPDAIGRWLDHAHTHGLIPAVTSTSEAGASAYRDAGLHPLLMGDEAVIDTRRFDLTNPAMRPVRRSVERVRAAGYEVRVRRQSAIAPAELAELVDAADRWRRGDERGYSMALERLGDPVDPRVVIVSAHDADGACRGILSFVPWGRRGLSLDVMRRSPDAVGGVTETMVSGLATASRDLGVDRISMNFAMFRETFELGERIGATPVQRLNRRVLLLASHFWQLEQLYRSNEKYLPDWQPRLLCYEAGSQLTRVVFALGQAEGFLPRTPRWLTGAEDRDAPDPERHTPAFVAQVVAQEDELLAVTPPVRRLTEQQRVRHAKLDVLRQAGMDPYPVAVPRTHGIGQVRALLATSAGEAGDGAPAQVSQVAVVGRLVRLRDLGGVVFAVLREGTDEVQAILTADGGADVGQWRRTVDLGDQVSVTGTLGRSRSGEPSVVVSSWRMAGKALTPPPDKHRGLVDPETRLRLRYMDLALHDRAEHLLRARSVAVWSIRRSLTDQGFLEVETPILQRIHGGANARPFRTHINAYNMDLYLRIAPELYLKQLMVGGAGRVFELGRNFRNEGVDATHNPEFTSVEAYAAFGDYLTMRDLTRELIVAAAVAVHGEPVAHRPDGSVVRLDGEWPSIGVHEAVSRAVGAEITPDLPLADLRRVCEERGVAWDVEETHGALVNELYDRFVEGQTVEPTFYLDFPVETSPLTRQHRHDPRLAERWDLVAFGAELGTAYSELVDPVEQRARLTQQSILAAAGDPEAMEIDEDFLAALEFAMPPTGGVGIGVDRVVMTLVGASIRETLAFPFLRPSGRTSGRAGGRR